MTDQFKMEEGSGSVFADLGLPNAEERLTKAELAIQIREAITARKLTQAKAAALLNIDQPKVSRLLRGQVSGFSTERLIQCLTMLGQDVMIVVKPAARQAHGVGHVSVVRELRCNRDNAVFPPHLPHPIAAERPAENAIEVRRSADRAPLTRRKAA